MDRDLSHDEQILRATREALKDEKTRREEAELQLELLHKVLVEYIYHNDSHNQSLLAAESRARNYLKTVGIIK